MGNKNLTCGKQLKHLMETHTPKLENAAELSRAMFEAGIFEPSKKTNVTDKESIKYKEATIRKHLNNGNVDSEFIIAYCDFFHCSADYLLGYISTPTHAAADIVKETGLWEDSLKIIQKKDSDAGYLLNALILSKEFDKMCSMFTGFLESIFEINQLKESLQFYEKLKVAKDTGDINQARYQLAYRKIFDNEREISGRVNDLDATIYRLGISFGNFTENFKDSDPDFIEKLYWGSPNQDEKTPPAI